MSNNAIYNRFCPICGADLDEHGRCILCGKSPMELKKPSINKQIEQLTISQTNSNKRSKAHDSSDTKLCPFCSSSLVYVPSKRWAFYHIAGLISLTLLSHLNIIFTFIGVGLISCGIIYQINPKYHKRCTECNKDIK